MYTANILENIRTWHNVVSLSSCYKRARVSVYLLIKVGHKINVIKGMIYNWSYSKMFQFNKVYIKQWRNMLIIFKNILSVTVERATEYNVFIIQYWTYVSAQHGNICEWAERVKISGDCGTLLTEPARKSYEKTWNTN